MLKLKYIFVAIVQCRVKCQVASAKLVNSFEELNFGSGKTKKTQRQRTCGECALPLLFVGREAYTQRVKAKSSR